MPPTAALAEIEALETQLAAMRERQQARQADIRQQRRDAAQAQQDAEQAERDAQQAERDAAQAERDAAQADQDARQARRDTEQARRDAAQAKRDAEQARRDEGTALLLRELRRDNLIQNTDNLQFSLSASGMTVNGKKQPAAVQQKYLRLLEQQQGQPLRGAYNLNYQTSGTSSTTIRGTGRMPSPSPPPASQGPSSPQVLPAPPVPPRPNTNEIRAALRRDGLIGATDKGFQFQLNGPQMTVNGQPQPAAVAEKYRRLLGVPPATDGKSNRNIQISVNE